MHTLFFAGDRIISVNGESVSGKSYAEVVGLIQRLRDNLSLIVVPKQDDILQMVSRKWPTTKSQNAHTTHFLLCIKFHVSSHVLSSLSVKHE